MRLSRTAAFYLQASIIVTFLAGSSAPTAIYALYQRAWGFSPITITVVFGTYALAVLATLLVVGSLSDYVGRQPVLLAAAILQAITMVVFSRAGGVETLLFARILQGIGTGMAAGAVGAGMLDLDRERGAVANAIGPMVGVATGALSSGLFVRFLPAPTSLIYLVFAVVFVAQAIGVAMMPETVSPRPGALASLKPKVGVPARLRPAFFVAVPALIATWALPGFYGSLGPMLVRRLSGSSSPALAGLALFALATGGFAVVLVTRTWRPRDLVVAGTEGLVTGVAMTLLAIGQGSVALFFVGTVIAGGGFGATFQGAIRSVMLLAEPHERASVLSVLYVVAYLSMGLPAVLGGLHLVHGGDIFATARTYGMGVIVLATTALVGTLFRRVASEQARASRDPVAGAPVPVRSR